MKIGKNSQIFKNLKRRFIMKLKNFLIGVCVILLGLGSTVTVAAETTGDVVEKSEFVKQQIEDFRKQYGEEGESAWARIFGWGEAKYNGDNGKKSIEWFCYTSSDALMLFVFSEDFLSEKEKKRIEKVTDILGRNWKVYGSMMATSNDWIFPYTSDELKSAAYKEDYDFMLRAQIWKISKLRFLGLNR